jgi:Ser/Thr protein kinase RdoA (MazF antagonist)
VVKTYTSNDDPASIHYEHRLLNWLAGTGLLFAVPVPIHTRDGASLCGGPFGWTSLSLWLPGSRLDPHRQDHVESLGAATGELQAALRHYPTTPRPGRPLFSRLFGFPLPFRDAFTLTPHHLGLPDTPPYDDLVRWWREEAAQLKAFVGGPYRALPW